MDYEQVEGLLSVLTNPASSPREVNEVLQLYSNIVQDDLSTVEAQVYIALAFDTKQGILHFLSNLHQTGKAADHSSAGNLKNSSEILEYLVANFKMSVEPHTDNIMKWALGTLRQETNICQASLKLMKTIVSLCPCTKVDMKYVVERLKTFLDEEKKLCSTSRQCVFAVLGEICSIQPAAISEVSDWFVRMLIRLLNENETAKIKSNSLVEGCFIGFFGYLANFSLPPETVPILYKFVKEFSRYESEERAGTRERHTANRAAVRLYIKYASVFAEFICNEASSLIEIFSDWIKPSQASSEHKHLGTSALTETYRLIASNIDNLEENDAKILFNSVRKELTNMHTELYSYSNKKAVIGLGELSRAYVKLGYNDELLSILNTLISDADSSIGKDMFPLYIYLVAIAKILAVLDKIPTLPLCRLSIYLVEQFPRISSNFKISSADSLEASFAALLPRGVSELESHVRVVFYQGLIRSCAHPLYLDVQLIENEQKPVESYKSFLPLWKHLLTVKSRTGASVVGSILYDSFILEFVNLIQKLDLSLSIENIELSDPSLAYEAKTPSDFQIFVNLVDLFQDVIPDSDSSLLLKWLPFLFHEAMRLSKISPLVSGFYKILAVTFKIAGSGYTLDDPVLHAEMADFMKEALSRILMQKDDLQIACLTMILRAPTILIVPILDRIDSTLSVAVRVGTGYPELLQLLISSLDIWLAKFPHEKMRNVLHTVLPLMRNFLLSPVKNQLSERLAKNDKKSLKVGGKIKIKVIAPSDKQSLSLQKQFILFLGKLDPLLYSVFTEPVEGCALPRGTPLHYKIPFHGSGTQLQLNRLVPRLLDIVSSSGDRSTRVTACELLHAVILLAIERTQKPRSNPELFRKLVDTALTLSCDSDKVIHDLFNPFLLQICRYYSSNIQNRSKETAVVIEIITEGCAHPFDSSIRDFSGLCLKEFVVWSRRQQSDENSPANVRAIIRTICNYSSHPERNKRLGAAIMFNNIYSEIREDIKLISVYWFQLFHCLMHSLEKCDDDETARVLKSSIQHIRRPLIEMKHIFVVLADNRRIPEEFRGGTLIDLAIYTFYKGSSLNKHVREVSRDIFMALLKIMDGRPSMREFLSYRNVSINLRTEGNTPESIVAILDYVNWLLEDNAVNIKDIETIDLFDLASNLLSEILQQQNFHIDTITCLLRFFSNTSANVDMECSESLAHLLFKLNIPVHAEFVTLLKKLKSNKSSFESFITCLPRLDKEYLARHLRNCDQISFFLGFEILLDASMVLTESYAGNELLAILFNSLFAGTSRRALGKFIDPRFKKHLMKMFEFAVKCGVTTDAVFDYLMDNTPVHCDGKPSTKGSFFFAAYEDLIVDFIIANDPSGDYILKHGDVGISWLIKILKHCQEKRKFGDVVGPNYLKKWTLLNAAINVNKTKFTILELLSSHKQFGAFVDSKDASNWIHKFLRSKTNSINDLGSVFVLLPHLSSHSEVCNDELVTSLTTFRRLNLSYFDKPRPENSAVIKPLYKGLLASLKATSSIVVLDFVAKCMGIHQEIISMDDIDSVLCFIAENTPKGHVLKIANDLFALKKLPEINLIMGVCIRDRLANFLQSFTAEMLLDFFGRNMQEIYDILLGNLHYDDDRRKLRDETTCVRLLEVLFLRTTKQQRRELQERMKNIPDLYKDILRQCSSWKMPIKGIPLNRDYNIACVKLFCAMVCQNNIERFYRTWLFGFPIWKYVTNFEEKYDFKMELAQLPKRKKVLTSIRQNQKGNEMEGLLYPQSVALFESSLREDVTKFDMCNLTLSKNTRITSENLEGIRAIELELDDLNKHDVVAPLCGVIQHMVEEKIQPEDSMPCWLISFKNVLIDGLGYNNAKLLVLKIIHNLQDFVKPYASQCAPDILKTIVSFISETGANYLATDLIAMLLDWHPDLNNYGRDLTLLIKHLLDRPGVTRKDALKYILDIVKSIIEKWKEVMDPNVIAGFLLQRTTEADELHCYISLHFASIVLTNNLFPSDKENIARLCNWLLERSKSQNKDFELASEVLGQALNRFRGIGHFSELSSQVCSTVFELNRMRTKDAGSSNADIRLYNIFKFYPEISSHELVADNLVVRALQDTSTVRQQCLEMLLSHVKRGQELQDAATLILETLKVNTPLIVNLSTQIFVAYMAKLSNSEIPDILEQIIKLSGNIDPEVRSSSSEALIQIMRQLPNLGEKLQNDCKIALLQRLNDTDDSVRNACQMYWYDLKLANSSSKEKWLRLFKDLYSPEAESEFAAYACALILGEVSAGPIYEDPIFDHPLGECSYTDYQILSSWRAQHSTLAPMFAPSVASELGRVDSLRPVSASAYQQHIRATARSLLFSPTLSDEPLTSFLSNTKAPESTEGEVFKKPTAPRRFLKTTKANTSSRFARLAVVARDKAETELKERVKRRDSEVKLYRSYRKGDYPDIQIKHSHFIAPLINLARKDTPLAKQLVVDLLNSITDNISKNDHFWDGATEALNTSLRTSLCDSSFLNIVFQLAIENDLFLDPACTYTAAKSADLMTAGSLVIEQAIVHDLRQEGSQEKRGREYTDEDEISTNWLNLAQLYQHLRDPDGQQGIFLDKLAVTGSSKSAIFNEAALMWNEAVDNYRAALENSSESRIRFYFLSVLRCLEHLSEWPKISEVVLRNVENEALLWEDGWHFEFLLPLYIHGIMMTTLDDKTDKLQTLLGKLKGFESRFQFERTVGSWLDQNYPKTLNYFNRSCMSFLSDWSQVNNWDVKRKESNLQQLPLLSEMNDVVQVISAVSRETAINQMLKNWTINEPSTQASINVWDTRLAIRKRFALFLEDSGVSELDLERIQTCVREKEIVLAKTAIELENFSVAKKYYKSLKQKSNRDAAYFYDLLAALENKLKKINPNQKVNNYMKICDKMEHRIANAMDADDFEGANFLVKTRLTMLNIISAASTLVKDHKLEMSYPRNLKEAWIKNANAALEVLGSGENEVVQRGELYVDIAKFYRKNDCQNVEIVKAILNGMRFNNSEAKQLFGWVLTMDKVDENLEISDLSASVPTWMFLFWRNQLLAFLAKGESNFRKTLIKRIALEYPKSISHSYRVSLECYPEATLEDGFIKELRRLLSDPQEELFVKALSRIASPVLKFKYYLEKAQGNISNLDVAKAALKEALDLIMDEQNGSKYQCLQTFRTATENLLLQTIPEALKENIKSVMKDVDVASKNVRNDKQLKLYSPWLSNFQTSTSAYDLEIPGQYSGLTEPNVKNHIRIAGFKPELLCLPSKRQPFKVTILGNDAKEYSFLVKFGEDLRQDERIQQVLKQMLNTLHSKKMTSDLHLDGFSVIPLTTACGMIQWLDSTISLKELVTENNINLEQSMREAAEQHILMLRRGMPNPQGVVGVYAWAYGHLGDEDAINGYHGRMNRFPEFALRDKFCSLSSSPEQMAYFRGNFAKSLATMSIAHWLIGVGDRHLDNTLVSTRTGRVIGIDFGLAFGAATQVLVPVELVPFRLTPQIVNVFSPLKESGWLKQAMIRSLRTLREDPSTLLAMLEVFVLEPSLDWKQHAERLAKERGVEFSSDVTDVYHRQKIDTVERKVRGAHPAAELENDVRKNRCINERILLRLINMLNRNSTQDIRERVDLSPEEQVGALIDLAMDPLILSFTYVGWAPWL